MQRNSSPIILALDTDDLSTAANWIEATKESIDIYKVGLEFFLKFGASGLRALRDVAEFELFLDLKLHDIPNTVAGAVSSVSDLQPRFLTVHASGGPDMVRAASEISRDISITAVTVLTSLNEDQLLSMGLGKSPLDLSLSLATSAVAAGARAIVSSPLEVSQIRQAVGPGVTLITPGVRPADSALGDQSRTMHPREALAAGADFLVIGRPITSYFATSKQAMADRAKEILDSLYK